MPNFSRNEPFNNDQIKDLCTLADFLWKKSIINSDKLYTYLGHLESRYTDRIISIGAALPKAAKASTAVTVACHCY
jgi:hypothetical protein